ncbi:MAG TPA: hypothetical protein VI461_14810, partial [Chitinophagaceae bacterium]|nr:hypothetical protein [Chitinophagaceae bacterium]
MKKNFFLLTFFISAATAFSQGNTADTNYAVVVTSIDWMPDGKAMLLSMVKYHKTDRKAPFFSRVFKYDLLSKKTDELFENGSNLAPSPDGKTIAFLKRDDKKRADIYLYDTKTRQQTVLKTDTMSKNALSWSPDGKKLLYNI